MSEKILIVEDNFIEANNLQLLLERAGYVVSGIAASVDKALTIISREMPDFVLLDIFLRGEATGIDLARELRKRQIAFIYLSANSDKTTLEAAKATVPYGFLVKPFREKDVLVSLEIARYLHLHNSDALTRRQSPQPASPATPDQSHGIVGNSPQLQEVLRQLQIVAPVDTAVLLTGESGTGKEVMARYLHAISPRRRKPMVMVNCAALPATLIESILFGYEKGAFTGAREKSIGKFEQADGGTIFLDEISEIPLELQSKLLRVLQEKEVDRIGSASPKKVDVRIIAASNRNLEKEVAEGRFRMDLYYRIHVFPVNLPPLRERRDDIALLAEYFVALYGARTGRQGVTLSKQALDELRAHHWPGNIRELEHTLERAVLLSENQIIQKIPLPVSLSEAFSGGLKTFEENERQHIITVLRQCNGKIYGPGGAAEILDMNVSTLNSRIKKLGIDKEAL
ncbi:sigma-54 dependent transcriptional regulator [Chitinophaga sedimenti]|uniref:sigma-54-dependent transcriptional regulator n=1 Tax=Chitinophaga sedimenti TaxID=2033606 RepID=UPI00200409B3|nr:sigma-54 dependent transcriptional regulator [Chitinophaga sedimenti]MCK7559333.1 sigma-54 dependent transcriptional regulator [Chitinophaga sedimenti]